VTAPEDYRIKAAQEAVAALIREINPGAMATRFVLLVEVIDADGERALWTLAPPEQRRWDTLGLVDFARALEYSRTAWDEREARDE
jgi:hypothetical protein